jgi:hypothetical protein
MEALVKNATEMERRIAEKTADVQAVTATMTKVFDKLAPPRSKDVYVSPTASVALLSPDLSAAAGDLVAQASAACDLVPQAFAVGDLVAQTSAAGRAPESSVTEFFSNIEKSEGK